MVAEKIQKHALKEITQMRKSIQQVEQTYSKLLDRWTKIITGISKLQEKEVEEYFDTVVHEQIKIEIAYIRKILKLLGPGLQYLEKVQNVSSDSEDHEAYFRLIYDGHTILHNFQATLKYMVSWRSYTSNNLNGMGIVAVGTPSYQEYGKVIPSVKQLTDSLNEEQRQIAKQLTQYKDIYDEIKRIPVDKAIQTTKDAISKLCESVQSLLATILKKDREALS